MSATSQTNTDAGSAGRCPVAHHEGNHATGCPVRHEEFFAPRPIGAHWALSDRLREESGVHWNTHAQGYWMFTSYEACAQIYKQQELFSSDSLTPWDPDPAYRFIPTYVDEPDHMKYRKMLNPWFTAREVAGWEERTHEVCAMLVDRIIDRGECDFIRDFSLHIPTHIFLEFTGMSSEDTDQIVRWVDDFFLGYGGDPETQQTMLNALKSLQEYWAGRVAERRGETEMRPRDLVSYLMLTPFGGERLLTDDELNNLLTLLVIGGLDTTRGQLSYLFWHLATHPEDRQRLLDEPELIPSAVEEALRFYGILMGDGRKVTRDAEFFGAQLKQGDMVWAVTGSANRDPSQRDRANEFVIDRKGSNHMTFGLGAHRCLGLHLARMEMRIATEEWLKRIPEFSIDSEDPLMERGAGSMLSPMTLPLSWKR